MLTPLVLPEARSTTFGSPNGSPNYILQNRTKTPKKMDAINLMMIIVEPVPAH
jgi:hypothetical protein